MANKINEFLSEIKDNLNTTEIECGLTERDGGKLNAELL